MANYGLKKGTVRLSPHDEAWEVEASRVIARLWEVFSSFAVDVQHIGSTAIGSISAKPIIDIAVGVVSFEGLESFAQPLQALGVYRSAGQPFPGIVLFSRDDATGTRLNNIQVVIHGSPQWNQHIRFRDHLNAHPEKAAEYDAIKQKAAWEFPTDVLAYTNRTNACIEECLKAAETE